MDANFVHLVFSFSPVQSFHLVSNLLIFFCLPPDSVERFHISAFIIFILAQNILEAEGPWFESFLYVSFSKRFDGKLFSQKEKNISALETCGWETVLTFWLLQNAGVVFVCEMIIDIVKHSFIAKFNDIKPIAYSEFLEDLCKQVLFCPNSNSKVWMVFLYYLMSLFQFSKIQYV